MKSFYVLQLHMFFDKPAVAGNISYTKPILDPCQVASVERSAFWINPGS